MTHSTKIPVGYPLVKLDGIYACKVNASIECDRHKKSYIERVCQVLRSNNLDNYYEVIWFIDLTNKRVKPYLPAHNPYISIYATRIIDMGNIFDLADKYTAKFSAESGYSEYDVENNTIEFEDNNYFYKGSFTEIGAQMILESKETKIVSVKNYRFIPKG